MAFGSSTLPLLQNTMKTDELGSKNGIRLGLKLASGAIFFIVVLSSSVLSKLTLVSLTDSLRYHTWMYQNKSADPTEDDEEAWVSNHRDDTVSLYWQLLFILLVPNCLTFLRCLFFGFLGKTKMTYPWPTRKAVLLVSACTCIRSLGSSYF